MAVDSETARSSWSRPTFGAAREAEQMGQGIMPAAHRSRARNGNGPDPLAFITRMRPWASSRDVSLWRRLRCRGGRHEVLGGERMQVGGNFVFLAPRCRWCDGAEV